MLAAITVTKPVSHQRQTTNPTSNTWVLGIVEMDSFQDFVRVNLGKKKLSKKRVQKAPPVHTLYTIIHIYIYVLVLSTNL